MNPMIQAWKNVAQGFADQLAHVTPDNLEARTPCDQWCVSELIDHAMGAQVMVPGALGTELSTDLGDDRAAGWAALMGQIEATLSADGAMETVIPGPMGEAPAGQSMGIPTMDLLVHTWDLGKSLGNEPVLDEAAVAHALGALQPMDAMIRGTGMFGPKVEVPEGASVQDQLIAFTGRQP